MRTPRARRAPLASLPGQQQPPLHTHGAHAHTCAHRSPCHGCVTRTCGRSAGTHTTDTPHTRTVHTHGAHVLSGKDADRSPSQAPALGQSLPRRAHECHFWRSRGLPAPLSAGKSPGQATSALVTANPAVSGCPASQCVAHGGDPRSPGGGRWAPQTPPASATYRREREEGDGEDGEAGGDGLPDPGLRHLVPVADGGDRDL